MSFLKQLLAYKRICIQCHDNPDADAVASAFGVYRYLISHGVEVSIVYGGEQPIKKSSMKNAASRVRHSAYAQQGPIRF